MKLFAGNPKAKPLVIEDAPHMKPHMKPTDGYRELAKRAGFDGAETVLTAAKAESETDSLRRFLAENGLAVYDDWKVIRYMDAITPRGYEWWWVGTNRDTAHRWTAHDAMYHLVQVGRVYSKPIPEAVLMTMAKIRDQFVAARFEVTDIRETPKADPFLRVSVDGNNWFIIERWDEPKFRS